MQAQAQARQTVAHLHSDTVHQWWPLLQASFVQVLPETPVGAAKPQCREPAVPCPFQQTGSQQLLASGSWHHAPVEAGPQCTGDSPGEAAPAVLVIRPGAVLALVLQNYSNHCYANSLTLAILWSLSCTPQGIASSSGEMRRLLAWLVHKPRAVSLWSVRAWARALARWQSPDQQHDAAEFLPYLAHVLPSDTLEAHWQSRIQSDSASHVQVVAGKSVATSLAFRSFRRPALTAFPDQPTETSHCVAQPGSQACADHAAGHRMPEDQSLRLPGE